MLISAPFTYRLHGFPTDFWRFTPSGLYTLLEEFSRKVVFAIGPSMTPSTVFAVVGNDRPGFDASERRLQDEVSREMSHHTRRHALKVLEERTRELVGVLTGRGRVGVAFYDPKKGGGYL